TVSGGQLERTDRSGTETIPGPAAGVTISGNNASRVFQIDGGVTAPISGLTITGGNALVGGGLYNLGTATLTNCTISGNSATCSLFRFGYRGGLYTLAHSTPTQAPSTRTPSPPTPSSRP